MIIYTCKLTFFALIWQISGAIWTVTVIFISELNSYDVLKYLARYSHRTAISNNRILDMEDNQISFSYKDYRDDKRKVMCLESDEFIRRFLQHVLPKGLQRIHHYGFLANACRKTKLGQVRQALKRESEQAVEPVKKHSIEMIASCYSCPKCHEGLLLLVMELKPKRLDGGWWFWLCKIIN